MFFLNTFIDEDTKIDQLTIIFFIFFVPELSYI